MKNMRPRKGGSMVSGITKCTNTVFQQYWCCLRRQNIQGIKCLREKNYLFCNLAAEEGGNASCFIGTFLPYEQVYHVIHARNILPHPPSRHGMTLYSIRNE